VIYDLRDRERKLKSEQKMMSLQLQGSRRSLQPTSPERKRRMGVLAEGSSSSSNHQPNPVIPSPKVSTNISKFKKLSIAMATFTD